MPEDCPLVSECGRYWLWPGCRGARGAYVRSLSAVFLYGIAMCDHPTIGSAAHWQAGVPVRQAARANLSLAAWAAQQGLAPPAPAALLAAAQAAGQQPNPIVLAWAVALAAPPVQPQPQLQLQPQPQQPPPPVGQGEG